MPSSVNMYLSLVVCEENPSLHHSNEEYNIYKSEISQCLSILNKPGRNRVLILEHLALPILRNVGARSRCVFISFTGRSPEPHHVHTICFVNRDHIRNVVSVMAHSLLHMCD
jgi:hypothetical protein